MFIVHFPCLGINGLPYIRTACLVLINLLKLVLLSPQRRYFVFIKKYNPKDSNLRDLCVITRQHQALFEQAETHPNETEIK